MWFTYALLSAVFYALLWVFVRMSKGIPSTVVTAVEFIPGPFLFLYFLTQVDYPWGETWWQLYLIFPFVLIPFFVWAMTYALHRIEVTSVMPLFGLSSIATLFVAASFFGEQVTTTGIAGIAIITAGLFCLYGGRWEIWRQKGPWIVLAGAIFFGVNAAIAAKVLHKFPHIFALLAVIFTGAFIGNAPFALRDLKHVRWSSRVLLILIAIVCANVAHDIFTLIAFTHGPSSYVIAIKRTSILFTAVIGYVFLKERGQPLMRLLLASGLVVGGVVLLTVG